MRKAFTMLEIIFVIVIIGILSAVAIPKFATNRDDATVTQGISTLASIRSAISQEAQRRQMEGNYTAINNIGGKIDAASAGNDKPIFDFFDTDNNGNPPANPNRVLEYPPYACKNSTAEGCWIRTGSNTYEYKLPGLIRAALNDKNAKFILQNNRFDCNDGGDSDIKKACRKLER